MAEDKVLESLRCYRLQKRLKSVSVQELDKKNREVEMAKGGLLQCMKHTYVVECGRWRTAPLSEECNIFAGGSYITAKNVGDGDKADLIRDGNTAAAYHVSIGYVSNDHAYPVAWNILWLARVDAGICYVMSILSQNDTRGGHLQQEYFDTFFRMLKLSTSQLIGTVRAYVNFSHKE